MRSWLVREQRRVAAKRWVGADERCEGGRMQVQKTAEIEHLARERAWLLRRRALEC